MAAVRAPDRCWGHRARTRAACRRSLSPGVALHSERNGSPNPVCALSVLRCPTSTGPSIWRTRRWWARLRRYSGPSTPATSQSRWLTTCRRAAIPQATSSTLRPTSCSPWSASCSPRSAWRGPCGCVFASQALTTARAYTGAAAAAVVAAAAGGAAGGAAQAGAAGSAAAGVEDRLGVVAVGRSARHQEGEAAAARPPGVASAAVADAGARRSVQNTLVNLLLVSSLSVQSPLARHKLTPRAASRPGYSWPCLRPGPSRRLPR